MSAAAEASEHVQTVTEGRAEVVLPPSVFYNRVQEFNRDLTIAVITQYGRDKFSCADKAGHESEVALQLAGTETGADAQDEQNAGDIRKSGLRILEGLAASGLRSVRFALEIPNVAEVIANDYDAVAVDFIKANAERNGVSHLVQPSHADASMMMYSNRRRSTKFHVIDLDPYGSPAAFLDAAVQSVADGGVLCVTCTDMAVLCGNAAETCFAKYGAVSLRAPFCHEMAVRILLQSIASHAARYQRYIEPILSLSIDFYARVFVRLQTGQSRVKEVASQIANVYQCRCCGAFALEPLMMKPKHVYVVATGPPVDKACSHCGGRHVVAGPIWAAPIHDLDFVRKVCDAVTGDKGLFPNTRQRIIGMLSVVCEELPDQPLYYVADDLCRVLHCTAIGFLPMRSALLHAGYRVSSSHADKNSVKTNAPANVIWDIMRCWVRAHPINESRLQDGSAAKVILSKEPKLEANFELHPFANPKSRIQGLVRWQLNPDRDWGPKPRAARSGNESIDNRRSKGEQKKRERREKRKAERDLKRFICKKFCEGDCDLGEQCRYSHRESALEEPLDLDTSDTA